MRHVHQQDVSIPRFCQRHRQPFGHTRCTRTISATGHSHQLRFMRQVPRFKILDQPVAHRLEVRPQCSQTVPHFHFSSSILGLRCRHSLALLRNRQPKEQRQLQPRLDFLRTLDRWIEHKIHPERQPKTQRDGRAGHLQHQLLGFLAASRRKRRRLHLADIDNLSRPHVFLDAGLFKALGIRKELRFFHHALSHQLRNLGLCLFQARHVRPDDLHLRGEHLGARLQRFHPCALTCKINLIGACRGADRRDSKTDQLRKLLLQLLLVLFRPRNPRQELLQCRTLRRVLRQHVPLCALRPAQFRTNALVFLHLFQRRLQRGRIFALRRRQLFRLRQRHLALFDIRLHLEQLLPDFGHQFHVGFARFLRRDYPRLLLDLLQSLISLAQSSFQLISLLLQKFLQVPQSQVQLDVFFEVTGRQLSQNALGYIGISVAEHQPDDAAPARHVHLQTLLNDQGRLHHIRLLAGRFLDLLRPDDSCHLHGEIKATQNLQFRIDQRIAPAVRRPDLRILIHRRRRPVLLHVTEQQLGLGLVNRFLHDEQPASNRQPDGAKRQDYPFPPKQRVKDIFQANSRRLSCILVSHVSDYVICRYITLPAARSSAIGILLKI